MRRWVDRLGVRSPPHYGQLLLVLALLNGVYAASGIPIEDAPQPTGDTITLLSWLPAAVRHHPAALLTCALVFVVAALAWVVRALVPLSAWATASAYTATVALLLERATYVDHTCHLTALVLWILAAWYHLCRDEIRTAERRGAFFRTDLYPAWVSALIVFEVGLHYTLAGYAKLVDSGLGWPNGLSLQLWTLAFSESSGPAVDAVLASRTLATALQVVALAAETSALFAAPSRFGRVIVGALLIGFHVGQHLLFGWRFGGNLVFVALAYLPVRAYVERVFAERRARAR